MDFLKKHAGDFAVFALCSYVAFLFFAVADEIFGWEHLIDFF